MRDRNEKQKAKKRWLIALPAAAAYVYGSSLIKVAVI